MLVVPVRPEIPIYVAALGHKMVEYAAQAADGWLPLFFSHSKALDVWGTDLKRGGDRRSGTLARLEICAGGIVAIGPEAERFRDRARPQLALYIGGMGARG
jgi:alkanesulfonate monooxygenase SsuD/methylene tetrahydromethanopterin reductase-like flavin-dependent oxidoreductase (luciferase family)